MLTKKKEAEYEMNRAQALSQAQNSTIVELVDKVNTQAKVIRDI